MSSNKKDDEKPETSPESSKRDSSKEGKKDNKPPIKKRLSQEGFSILSALANFFTRERSESEKHLEPLQDASKSEIENNPSTQQGPAEDHDDVSSQTSDLSVHRSSVLNAISRAEDARKEARKRVVIVKGIKGGQDKRLKSSNLRLPTSNNSVHHDPYLLMRNENFDEEDASDRQSTHIQVSFKRNPSYFKDNDETDSTTGWILEPAPSEKHDAKKEHASLARSEISFHDAPKSSSRGKLRIEKSTSANTTVSPSVKTSRDLSFQTEPETQLKGAETQPKRAETQPKGAETQPKRAETQANRAETQPKRAETQPKLAETQPKGAETSTKPMNNRSLADSQDYRNNGHDLVRRIHTDGEKCSKCDLFEHMFTYGGEKVLNDKEILEMFKRHMNSHLDKAREELNKLDKLHRKVTEIEDVPQSQSDRQMKRSNPKKDGETTTTSKINKTKYGDNETYGMLRKTSLDMLSPSTQMDLYDKETRSRIDQHSNLDSETKDEKRESPDITKHSRSRVSVFEQMLKDYLANKKESCSEDVIIRRRHCHHKNDRYDSRNRDSLGRYDEGYYRSDKVGSSDDSRRKSDKGYHRDYESHRRRESDPSRDKRAGGGGGCFCKRYKYCYRPVAANLINCRNWAINCSDDDDYDECSCEYIGTEAFSVRHGGVSSPQRNNLSDTESQLEWFVKGMLAALKSHQEDATSANWRESNKTKSGARSNIPPQQVEHEGKQAKNGADVRENQRNGQESFQEQQSVVAEKQPYSSVIPTTSAATETEENSSRATEEKSQQREQSVPSNMTFNMVKTKDGNDHNGPGGSKNQSGTEGIRQNREGSILSKMAFFMLKQEDVNNRIRNIVSASETAAREKQENAEQYVQTEESPGPENSESELKSDNIQSEKLYNGFNLDDPNVQEFVRNILRAFCEEFIYDNEARKGSDSGFEAAEISFGCATKSDDISQAFCKDKDTTAGSTARAPPQPDSNEGIGGLFSCEGKSSRTCSYFYPYCRDKPICNGNRSANEAESCCCSNRTSNKQNSNDFCPAPLQDAFQQYHSMCYSRVKRRPERISSQKQDREKVNQQRERIIKQTVVKARTNCCRPYTSPLTTQIRFRPKNNKQCGCNNVINGRREQAAWEPFTYVVPRSHMYWQCFYE